MKGRGGLNQPLQEGLLRFGLSQPKFFPHLVRLEKLFRVEERDAALELVAVDHAVRASEVIFDRLDARQAFSSQGRIISAVSVNAMTNVTLDLPGVTLGILEADTLRVAPTEGELAQVLEEVCRQIQRSHSVESLAEAESTRAVRAMFRVWGVDPSKYRPSSEALQRRVVQGKGLYRVSNVVDIGNLGSIETGWPYGLYDRNRIVPPVSFRHGATGETYEGIGKRTWHLADRPVLVDANGPFCSPISDSTRTMVTDSSQELLAIIYAPENALPSSIESALARLGERLARFAGARAIRSGVCPLNTPPAER
jgi:DNA/RNA-binding domain of Phe-tRNA-synthetase-like protein